MASYTNEYSRLPNEILTLHNYKDVDDTVAPYVNQIKILQAQGKYDKANEVMKTHPELSLIFLVQKMLWHCRKKQET